MYEIRWHSRAGQGAITVANALCEIVGMAHPDLHAQAFPDYGAEKKGAPVVVFNRFSESEILPRNHIESPNLVVLLDTTLINESELSYEHILEGTTENSTLLLNTKQDKTKFSDKFSGNIYHIDATGIATDEIGKNIPNVPMLGALILISTLSPFEVFTDKLKEYLLNGLPAKIVEGNMRAFLRGAREYKKVQ